MGKPDALTCRTREEKSGAEERIFNEGQLQVLAMDGIEAEQVEDIQLDGIDCVGWERDSSGLLKVPEEHK